jgi:hypothetical protein
MIASAVVQTTTTTAAPSTLDLLSGIVASSPTSLPVDAARTYNAPSQFSCSTPALINLVGLGAEIFCHCDQCCDGLFIIIRRGQPMAEISLSSEVVGTRHIEIPFDQDQLLNLRRVPTVSEAGLSEFYSSAWYALWGRRARPSMSSPRLMPRLIVAPQGSDQDGEQELTTSCRGGV